MLKPFLKYAGIVLLISVLAQAPKQAIYAQSATGTNGAPSAANPTTPASLPASVSATTPSTTPKASLYPNQILQATLPGSINGHWTMDPIDSSITFTVRSLGISDIAGRFDKISGSITIDHADHNQSSMNIVIQAASVDTNNKQRDTLIRSAKFLDSSKYPRITFKSTSLQSIGDGSYIATGNLTLHGVTQQIMLPFTIAGPIRDTSGTPRFGLQILTSIDRQDYGMTQIQRMDNGSVVLSDDIDLSINIQAVPAKASGS